MRSAATQIVRSVVCVGHTAELYKTAEPIEMPFGGVFPRHHWSAHSGEYLKPHT